jgi:hypothetical protein
MAGITTSDISDALEIAVQETKLFINSNVSLLDTIDVYNIGRETVKVPYLTSANVSATAHTQNAASTISDITGAGATITAGRIHVATRLSELSEIATPEDYGKKLGEFFGRMILEKINQNIFTLFDGFSTAVGTSNVDITLNLIQQALSTLEKAGAPTNSGVTLAITPHVAEDLRTAILDASGSAFWAGNALQQYGTIPDLFGCKVIVVKDLAAGTSAGQRDAADIKCGLYCREALAANIARGLKVTVEEDRLYGGSLVVADILAGVAEQNDSYGVEILVDNKD